MSRFMTVVEQNNEAVAFLKTRDFQNASDTFSSAMATHRAVQDTSDLRAAYQHSDECLDHCMLLSAIEDDETTDLNNNQTFIYKHGIILHPSVADPAIITTILVFNTALAHHLAAESSGCPTPHHFLFKARRLYELAMHNAGDSMDHNLLFQFAAINNVMVIDRALGVNEREASHEFFDYLVSVLMVLVDRRCDRRLRHVEGFLMNIPSPIKTAAAA